MILKAKERKAVNEFISLLIQKMSRQINELVLFGSRTRGHYHRDSDIDVLVLVNREDLKTWEMIQSLSAIVSLKFDLVLSALVMDEKRYKTHCQLKTLLFRNISRDGIRIWKRK